jgi:hypothetical protein
LKRRVLRVHHLREGGFGWRWCDLCCWCRRSYVVDVLISLLQRCRACPGRRSSRTPPHQADAAPGCLPVQRSAPSSFDRATHSITKLELPSAAPPEQPSAPVQAHRSSSESAPAERRRAAPRVSSVPDHLARCLRPSLPEPNRQTSPHLSDLAAAGEFASHLHSQACLGHVATGPGRHSRACEAFRPLAMVARNGQQGEALGQFQARYCVSHF